ncbi:tachylectin-related carbohydrate-binding protein [Streptomyces sp. ID05-26A]|nr:tachylectin-related carbohydrate-binding protein [Streptomyces sp. ID05-26A]
MAVAVVLGTAVVPNTATVAQAADDYLTCNSEALVFSVYPNGTLWLYPHQEPETGAPQWSQWTEIGSGWDSRAFGGRDRRVYDVKPDGTLWRFRLDPNTGWEDGGAGRQIATGWQDHADPNFKNRVTVDSLGHFYLVDKQGNLHWRSYDEPNNTWNSTILDTGWDQYDLIAAAGNGVIYARKPGAAGELHRYRYHAPSQRWLQYAKPVGFGWQMFNRVFSPGGDVLYGVRPDTGQLLWYRYNETANTWQGDPVTQLGREVGSGWHDDLSVFASSDNCSRVTEPNPDRPVVPRNRLAAAALTKTSNGHLQYAYVADDGRLVHAEVQDIYNVGPNGFQAFPGHTNFTGVPSVVDNQNGSLRIAAHTEDSEARGALQAQPGSPFGNIVSLAGWMQSPPQLVRTANGLVSYVAVDKDGFLWTRSQKTPNGRLLPWLQVKGQSFQTGAPRPTGQISAVNTGNTIKVVALRTDGTYGTAAISPTTETVVWQNNGGTGNTGPTTAVALDGDVLQLFARRSDGKIYTHSSAANGTWTPILGDLTPGGVKAAGPPAAVLAPSGTLEVTVRGDDGFVYRTGQKVPAATAWWDWHEITGYADETDVDPSMSRAKGLTQDTWVIAFRTAQGVPKLRRFEPTPAGQTAAARSAAGDGKGSFIDVPLSR